MNTSSVHRIARRRPGFTLIEILVVLAIIFLLAAILFPVFSSVREKGRMASCASNLKQLGLATQMYLRDYDDTFPTYQPLWLGMHCAWPEPIQSYVKETAVFQCPSYSLGEYKRGCPAPDCSGPVCKEFKGGYDRNTMNDSSIDLHETKLTHPASTIFLLDGSGGKPVNPGAAPAGEPANLTNFGKVIKRHQGGNNLLFADGHVKWRSYEALLERKQWLAIQN